MGEALPHLPQWKNRHWVIPIHKKGDRQSPANYRPISLTAIPCKILESLIRDKLLNHLLTLELLSKDQHGFRPRRSCTSQLLAVMEDWSCWAENGDCTDCIYLDYKKAFDSVPHQRLLVKLQAYGVADKLYTWINAFLTNRQQQVAVEGSKSPWARVTSGVPQGSVLGPLLFLIYVNDMPDVIRCPIKIFADDAKIYRQVTLDAGIEDLQSDIDAVIMWSDKWQMPFSESKCKSLHIGNKNRRHSYVMGDYSLEHSFLEKDLGIFMDYELKFRKQASAAAAKASQILAVIRRSFVKIDQDTLPLLYKSLVRPHLEYGNVIWGPFNQADKKLVENVQRRATKLIPDIHHLSYRRRLEVLNLPSLHYRRRRGDMVQVYQILNGGTDLPPETFFAPAGQGRTRGHRWKLSKPRAVSRVRRNAFSIRVINDWNALPSEVVDADNVQRFKAKLDTHWADLKYNSPDHF